ncbi:Uncharacterized protein dnm_078460 [Desulfonema magnum]|uniref:Uncharacterized protein n=1 Tax=Desulfonema magnum TaxID=45655 RepID=A0A975BUK6_9BACT|nr:Uncharacterized protein dnm_078460 [Desulfonema magnum]
MGNAIPRKIRRTNSGRQNSGETRLIYSLSISFRAFLCQEISIVSPEFCFSRKDEQWKKAGSVKYYTTISTL